jgi:putative transposase
VPRTPRLSFAGALYHITGRGINKQPIFYDDEDRTSFLAAVQNSVRRHNWLCHCFCLLPNHHHMLVETPEGNISAAMHYFLGLFARFFNRKYSRVGHVFQNRFHSILVQKESYLLQLNRYISLNPVRANLVSDPAEWQWSSYPAYIGKVLTPKFLHTDWILAQFHEDKALARLRYKNFVLNGLGEKFPWDEVKAEKILGDEKFVEEIMNGRLNESQYNHVERINRMLQRPSLGSIFSGSNFHKPTRNKRIAVAHMDYGYRIKEIALFLGVDQSTVGRAIRNAMQSGVF